MNALGQRVLSTDRSLKARANQFAIGTEQLAAGIYQLVVRSDDAPVRSRLFRAVSKDSTIPAV